MPKILDKSSKMWLKNGFFIAAGTALFTFAFGYAQRLYASKMSS